MRQDEHVQSPQEAAKPKEPEGSSVFGCVGGIEESAAGSSDYDSGSCNTSSYSELSFSEKSKGNSSGTADLRLKEGCDENFSRVSSWLAGACGTVKPAEARDVLQNREEHAVSCDWGAKSGCSREENPLLMEFPHDAPDNYYSFFIPEADFSYDSVAHNLFNASGTLIDRDREVSPGVLVERDEEFWDMEAVSEGGKELHVLPLPASRSASATVRAYLPGEIEGSFEMSLRLSSSSSVAFSGFEPSGAEGSLGAVLQVLEDRVKGMLGQGLQSEVRTPAVSAGGWRQQNSLGQSAVPLAQVQETVERKDHRPRLRELRSPVNTRSRGPVQALPHVQPTILEYKYRQNYSYSSTDSDSG